MPYEIPEMAGEPFSPDVDEVEAFTAKFCDRCTKCLPSGWCRDKIYDNAYNYGETDPNYPPEWTHDDKGRPVCTAFEECEQCQT